jgi:hypothetical protein
MKYQPIIVIINTGVQELGRDKKIIIINTGVQELPP